LRDKRLELFDNYENLEFNEIDVFKQGVLPFCIGKIEHFYCEN